MTRFDIPSAPKKYPLDIDNFNGVDFTSKVPDISRSNVCENIISRNGFHQVRKSIKQKKTKGGGYEPINFSVGTKISQDAYIYASTIINGMTAEEFREKYTFTDGTPVLTIDNTILLKEVDDGYNYGIAILNSMGFYDDVVFGIQSDWIGARDYKMLPLVDHTGTVTQFNNNRADIIKYMVYEPAKEIKLIKKIKGERWEKIDGDFIRVSNNEDMYVKISTTQSDGTLWPDIHDYFIASDTPLFDGTLSSEITFNAPLAYNEFDYYKTLFFNDTEYFFTQTGIYTVNLKKMVDGNNITVNIDVKHIEPKIPEYYIGATPELTNYVRKDPINMITRRVAIKYAGTAGTTNYKLLADYSWYNDAGITSEKIVAKVLNSNGEWTEYTYGNGFTISGNYLIFNTAPGISPLDGADNVEIIQPYVTLMDFIVDNKYEKLLFKKEIEETIVYEETSLNDNIIDVDIGLGAYGDSRSFIQVGDKIIYQDTPVENPYPNGKAWYLELRPNNQPPAFYKYRTLTECPEQTLHYFEDAYLTTTKNEYEILRHAQNIIIYGVDNANRVFMNNNDIQIFSDANDITYWPDTNYIKVGDETDIQGFGISNGALLSFKKGTNSIYVQQGITLNNKDAFQFIYSQTTEDVLSKPIQLETELYVFTTQGLQQITYHNGYLTFNNRSYFIDKKLQDMDFETMTYHKWDNNLYIMLKSKDENDNKTHIFVADLDDNSRVYEKSSSVGSSFSTGIDYQYEWYYLNTYIKPLVLTDYVYNNIFLAYNNDGLYGLIDNEELDYDYKYDEIWTYDNNAIIKRKYGIRGYWELPFIDVDNIMFAKTIRNFYMNTNSKQGDKIVVGYKTIDNGYEMMGTTIYNSVMDYPDFPRWTHVKDKIRKFMNAKFYITNGLENILIDDNDICGNCSFNRISLEYQMAGKYRGE